MPLFFFFNPTRMSCCSLFLDFLKSSGIDNLNRGFNKLTRVYLDFLKNF